MHGPNAVQEKGDGASRREVMHWIWPAGTRVVLAMAVIAAALDLGFASRSVPQSRERIVAAPDLLLDVNTVPAAVLETLPHVGQTLVRQLIAARDTRPIASLDDAGSRVRGLGPATLAQIAPYLRFEPSAQQAGDDFQVSPVDQAVAKSRSNRRKTPARSRKPKTAPAQPRLVSRSSEPGPL